MLAQARATALTGEHHPDGAVPDALRHRDHAEPPGAVGGARSRRRSGSRQSASTFSLVGTGALTVTDTRPAPGVSAIMPNPVNLLTPPAPFTITGNGFANLGYGLPVVNFVRGTTLIAQARATALTGSTTLTVPFPTQATAITPNMPGLSVGPVQAQVWQQTGTSTFTLIGTVTLTATAGSP